MKIISLPIRFMGKHPVFGKTARTRTADGQIKNTAMGVRFDKSPYYWWWRALRLSDEYELVCKNKGKSTKQYFAELYKDFGDVFNIEFESW